MNTDTAPTSLMRDREIWTFLVGIVLANSAFVYSVSRGFIPIKFYYEGRFFLLGFLLVCAVWLFRRWDGVRGLVMPLTVWRVNPAWFLLAVAWPPAIATLTLIGKGLLLGTGLSEIHVTPQVLADRGLIRNVLLGAFIGEIVWVGYAIGRLKNRTSTLLASIIVGVFWSLWWLPIVLIGVAVVPGIPVAALFMSMVGIAIMCGFVYAHTRSGLVVLALQLSVNSSVLIFPTAPHSGGLATYWAFSTIYLLAALLLHVVFGPRPLFSRAVAPAAQVGVPARREPA